MSRRKSGETPFGASGDYDTIRRTHAMTTKRKLGTLRKEPAAKRKQNPGGKVGRPRKYDDDMIPCLIRIPARVVAIMDSIGESRQDAAMLLISRGLDLSCDSARRR